MRSIELHGFDVRYFVVVNVAVEHKRQHKAYHLGNGKAVPHGLKAHKPCQRPRQRKQALFGLPSAVQLPELSPVFLISLIVPSVVALTGMQ